MRKTRQVFNCHVDQCWKKHARWLKKNKLISILIIKMIQRKQLVAVCWWGCTEHTKDTVLRAKFMFTHQEPKLKWVESLSIQWLQLCWSIDNYQICSHTHTHTDANQSDARQTIFKRCYLASVSSLVQMPDNEKNHCDQMNKWHTGVSKQNVVASTSMWANKLKFHKLCLFVLFKFWAIYSVE